MDGRIVIELTNGQKLEATWARDFVPSEKEVVVMLVNTREKRLFPLSRISYILMHCPPTEEMVPGKSDPLEVVECITGKLFHVRSLGDFQTPEGFYAIPTDKSSPYKMIFFPNGGVRCRNKYAPLGQILEEQGVVSREDINNALSEQERLKRLKLGEIICQKHDLQQDTIDQIISQAQSEGRAGQWLRVGDILVKAGLVTEEQVEEALASQEVGKRKKIGRLLIEKGLVTEEQVLAALATKFNLPYVDLNNIEPDNRALSAVSSDLVLQLKVFPVTFEGEMLLVASSKPTDPTISDSLRFHTNCQVKMVIAPPEQIEANIKKYYVAVEDKLKDLLDDIDSEDVGSDESEDEYIAEPDSETIRLSNRILIDAYQQGASDIHLEPGGSKLPLGVRYRVDGICRTIHMVPSRFAKPVVARIKIMANLDIAEHRKAQSGKIVIRFQGKKIEYRVEVTPSVGGNEDVVLRILAGAKSMPLEEMGFSPANLDELKKLVAKPYGIILCVGPTGSGKTTTLHAALGHINTPERKIWTVEDPVEITQLGLRQVEVKNKIGFTFKEALRSLLRADPDVVMIGEMRDREAAHTAIEASLTGHLVFSTLHTNSAPETVTRLIEMGEDPFNLADALLGIIAQRLTRKLCPLCKEAYNPGRSEYEKMVNFYDADLFRANDHPEYSDSLTLMRKKGCDHCSGSGYKGRIAIHELLLCTDKIKRTIKSKASVSDLQSVAVEEGMRTLRMDGVDKVLQGLTDLEQVMRVCL